MRGLLSIENWAVKESVMEHYRREMAAGRFPVIPKKNDVSEIVAYAKASKVENEDDDDAQEMQVDFVGMKAGQIAIVYIVGVMTRYGDACAYGTEEISKQLIQLDNTSGVVGIVLIFDTPGGDVNGMAMFAKVIKSLTKPKIAYAIQADSAGYWAASQCDEIILEDNAQAEVGSIGVYGILMDVQGKLEKEGVKIQIVRADGSEDKARINPYEDAPEDALLQQKSVLNAIRTEFIGMVQAKRLNVDAGVFSGKTYRAKDAMKFGLIDSVGSLQDAINRVDFLAR